MFGSCAKNIDAEQKIFKLSYCALFYLVLAESLHCVSNNQKASPTLSGAGILPVPTCYYILKYNLFKIVSSVIK